MQQHTHSRTRGGSFSPQISRSATTRLTDMSADAAPAAPINEDEILQKFVAIIAAEFPHRTINQLQCRSFLLARKFDVESALTQYRASLQWRDEFKIDTMLDRELPPMRELITHSMPIAHHRFAKTGAPVFIEQIGKVNVAALNKNSVTDDQIKLFHAWDMEMIARRCTEATQRFGRPITQNLSILDVAGLSMSHVNGLHYMKAIIAIDFAHYPNTLERMLVINTPAVFPIVWRILRPMLDPVTAAKIEIYDSSSWQSRLLELVDADQLPAEYGGTCSCAGGCIPRPQFDEKVTVSSRDKLVRRLPCPPEGGELAWSFLSIDHDIKFSVEFEPVASSEKTTIHALGKCDSHHFPVSNAHKSTQHGHWVVTWDNTYSFFTSKDVHFSLKVTELATITQAEESIPTEPSASIEP